MYRPDRFRFFAARYFSSTKLSVVPIVNPDGVDLVLNGPGHLGIAREALDEMNEHQPDFREWKANINGVDLNNQFPSFWEIENKENRLNPLPTETTPEMNR